MLKNPETDYVTQTLEHNKKRFTKIQLEALKIIASHPFDFRKRYEENNYRIPYLPSFKQGVEGKLAVINLELISISANDGTARKVYALRPIT